MRKTDPKLDKTEDRGVLRLPQSLSFKDLITIVSVAVSLTLAWGVFSTRIAVLEQEVVTAQQIHERDLGEIQKLQADVNSLEVRLNDHVVDDSYVIAGKRPPKHHSRDMD